MDQYWNTYSYCGADPVNRVDRHGLKGSDPSSNGKSNGDEGKSKSDSKSNGDDGEESFDPSKGSYVEFGEDFCKAWNIDPNGVDGIGHIRSSDVDNSNTVNNGVSSPAHTTGPGLAQTTLDLAGFIPGPVGVVADVTSASISFGSGDYLSGGLSLAFAVPVFGDIAAFGKIVLNTKGGTYTLRDVLQNKIVRSGRSKDLARRELEHARDPVLKDYAFEVVHRTDEYAEQRGLEQMLHDFLNPPLNKIKPINPKNPKLPIYKKAAEEFLEREIK